MRLQSTYRHLNHCRGIGESGHKTKSVGTTREYKLHVKETTQPSVNPQLPVIDWGTLCAGLYFHPW